MVTADAGTPAPSGLTAGQILALWERSAGLHPIDRAVETIASACPDRDVDAIRRLPLGERDSALLAIRRATIGDRLEARGACLTCGMGVELTLSCTQLLAGHVPAPNNWTLTEDGYRVRLRPLDSLDAAAAAVTADPEAARATLLARAVVRASHGRRVVDVTDLPASVVDAISRSLGKRDPGADLVLELRCPACSSSWSDSLDVANFVTAELSVGGRRLLGEIDLLARTYGWGEPEILALGDARRSAYVALVTG
jgi:hypothetical protein